MASSEITAMVGPARIREIQRTDPHPIFKAFVVGHEGEAAGYLVGVGNIVKRWFRSAVVKLHEAIQMGLKIFHGHGDTNDQAGRMAIGEVVGKKLMRIGDRVSTVVACHIFPEYRHLPLDIASIEASVDLEQDRARGLYVADVGEVTAIALSNSAVETPGFTGATLLGQVQAFAKNKHIEGEEFMDITIEDVKAFLKAEKVAPSDVFGVEDLTSDPAVTGFVENQKRSAVAGEYAHRKRTEEGFDKTRDELEKKVQAKEAEVGRLRLDAAKAQVPALFAKQKDARKLNEQQEKFVLARLQRFAPSKVEDVEKEFNAYLDSEIDECGRLAKDVFGIGPEKGEGGNGGEKKAGAEPDETQAGDSQSDYLNPAKNPMIKLD
jgi:hypothetical protein